MDLARKSLQNSLSTWAKSCFGMTALHPAGKDIYGNSRKDLWPPPEGTAPAPPEENNPLLKLLMDVSESQETLLEDHLLLCNRINIHRCSSYCLRKKGRQMTCRMEFGTEDKPGKQLRKHPAIVTDRNGSLRLEMERDHPMLVQHSQYHTQGWRANGDISIIVSKSSPDNPSINDIIATEKYVSGYACKGNEPTGAVVDLFNGIVNSAVDNVGNDTKSVCTKLLMNTVKRDISSMEASYELLSLPLYRCSHQFQTVSLSGSRVLERSGKTFTKNTPLDKYLARPLHQKCSWYSFICKQGVVPVISGSNVRASWPLAEDYCRSMLLLHWPSWRELADVKPPEQTWVQAMTDFLQTDNCPNFVKADVERARRHESEEFAADNQEESVEEDTERPAWMDILEPNKDFDKKDQFQFDDGGPNHDWSITNGTYPNDFGKQWLEKIDKTQINNSSLVSNQSLYSLNTDQKFAFSLILDTLINYKNKSSSFKPLRLIVSGTAGSGKSFLIKCLVHAIQLFFDNPKAVQVICPTGNSANLISSKTIHDFLKVPTGKQATKEMSPPDGSKGENLQENCQDLVALFIDERSLVGATTLGWMEMHCRHGLRQETISWGGLPVVVFLGDDVQLPPVCDSPVYVSTARNSAAMHGILVWKEFQHVVELQTIVRQNQDQEQLKSVLLSLREYKADSKHTIWLQKFQWHNLHITHGEELLTDMTENGLFVFPTHVLENNHNMNRLLVQNEKAPVARIVAVNNGPHSKQASCDKAGGLLPVLYLCVGAKVMLTSNIIVQYGLFNGSTGIVKDIVYLDGKCPENSLPDVVMVSFSRYSGPAFLSNDCAVIPIVPIERKVDCFCHGCKRLQIPLRLGWGTTIHKCQGMTIGTGETYRYIVIDPGSTSLESRNPGALFVALSRAKTAGDELNKPDFAWHPDVLVNEDRICHVVNTPTTRERGKEINRLRKLATLTRQQFHKLDNDDSFEEILKIVLNSDLQLEE